MPVELNSNNLFVQKREFLNITFKLNNIKYLCLSNLVRDILFQLIDQYISKKNKRFYWFLLEIIFTLIAGIFDLKRELNC
jgi:hypothetical protein